MTLVPPAPDAVSARIAEHGPIEEHGVPWNPDWWHRANLPVLRVGIERVAAISDPEVGGWLRVRRHHVRSLAPAPGDEIWTFFAAVMIWGYGSTGYGAARVQRILWARPKATVERNLAALVDAARRGPGQAWDTMRTSHRTHLLGPAFATKVAYFAAFSAPEPPVPAPLIADANTSWALWDLCRIPRSVEQRGSYLRYVDLAHAWAADKGWRPDDVERALFEIGKDVPRGR